MTIKLYAPLPWSNKSMNSEINEGRIPKTMQFDYLFLYITSSHELDLHRVLIQ